jgi:hypothetical protein
MIEWGSLWIDLIGLSVALVLFNGSLTGRFYSHGRGSRKKLIASTDSPMATLLFLILALGISAWLVVDLRRKLFPAGL